MVSNEDMKQRTPAMNMRVPNGCGSFIGINRHCLSGLTAAKASRFSPTARIQPFTSADHSGIIWLHKVSMEHLSFMEHSRHDNGVRIVDRESDQMAGLSDSQAC